MPYRPLSDSAGIAAVSNRIKTCGLLYARNPYDFTIPNNNGCISVTNAMQTSNQHGYRNHSRWNTHLVTKLNTEFTCNNTIMSKAQPQFEHVESFFNMLMIHWTSPNLSLLITISVSSFNDRTRRLNQRTSSYDADLTTKCQVPIETSGTRAWLQCSQVGNKHTNAFRLLRAHEIIDPLLLCTTICDCCTLATQKATPQSNNNGCGGFTNAMHTSYRHGCKRYAKWTAHLATKPNTEFSCNNKLHVESVTAIWTFWIFFEHVGESLHLIKAHRWSQSQHQFSW